MTTSQFLAINNFSTTVAAPVAPSDTTIVLSSSVGLPTIPVGDKMPITLNDAVTGQLYEICYVTAITGASLTVERAQEGTAALAWAVGDFAFVCSFTANTGAASTGNPSKTFMVAPATDAAHAVNLAQLNGLSNNFGTDSGAADAYVISLGTPETALTDGLIIYFKAANSNTGASTLNLDGLGIRPFTSEGNVAMGLGQIIAGVMYSAIYSTSDSAWFVLSQTGGSVGAANAVAANQAVALGQFTQSFATPGWNKLPDGTIYQWGTGSGEATTAFPIAFPTACLNVVICLTGGDATCGCLVETISAASFHARSGNNSGYEGLPIRWIAVGN